MTPEEARQWSVSRGVEIELSEIGFPSIKYLPYGTKVPPDLIQALYKLPIAERQALVARPRQERRAPLSPSPPATVPSVTPVGISLATLMARKFEPRTEFVECILTEGVTIFAGRAKLGKSWLLYNLALALAWGGMALGKIPVVKTGVLLLALEDGALRLQDRFATLLRDKAPPDALTIFTEWPRLDAGGLDQLDAHLSTHPDVKVVFIDTLAKVRPHRIRNGDMYSEDYAVGEGLKAIAERHRAAIVLVTHTRKAPADDFLDEISGTIGLTGGVDNCLVLKRDRGSADAVLCVAGRDIRDEKEYALSWDATLAQWTVAGDAEDFRMSRSRLDVLNVLRAAGTMLTPTEVAAQLDKPTNSVKQLLWQMAKTGAIKSTDGKYGARIVYMGNNPDNLSPETPATTGETRLFSNADENNPITQTGEQGYSETEKNNREITDALPTKARQTRENEGSVIPVSRVIPRVQKDHAQEARDILQARFVLREWVDDALLGWITDIPNEVQHAAKHCGLTLDVFNVQGEARRVLAYLGEGGTA